MSDPGPLDVLKAVLDPIRLGVLGGAVAGDLSIPDVARDLGVSRRDVAEAVGHLRNVGLLDAEGRLDRHALRAVAREIPAEGGALGEPVEGPWSEEEAQVLGRFFDGERLVEIPQAARKRRLVLERIALRFEPGRRYPERDVNFMIQLIHPDYAAIRRYMVEEGFMDRADGAYWRTGGRFEPLTDAESVDDAPPRILTTGIDGVELRPYDWHMRDDLVSAADDDRIPRFMGDQFRHPYTVEDAEAWLEVATKDDPPTQYAIYVDGAFAGGIGGFPQPGENTGSVEIGWWLNPRYWGRGITSACARALVDEFFEHREYMRLWAPVMHPNEASARVAEKAGLRFEGAGESAYLKAGVRYDQLNYGITRARWRAGT